MIVPESKSASMSPLMGPLYSQIMAQVADNPNGCPVFFLLDEFANIGKFGQISTILSTVRSRKMSLALGIQSFNQLKQNYGQEESGSIWDNLKIKCALPGLSHESANMFSQLVGFKEISTTSTSFGKDNLSHSVSNQKRELLTSDEVRRIPDNQMLTVADNRNPLFLTQLRYYLDEKMLKQTENTLDLDDYIIKLRKDMNKSNGETQQKTNKNKVDDDFEFSL
jgi:type IV secretion system protein VirD4